MSLNESIIKIRVELQKSKLQKSGKNKFAFANFEYFELSDFLPTLNELMLNEGMNDHLIISNDYAELTLIKGEERQTYTMPFYMFDVPPSNNNKPMMQQIQYLGALNTYYKRYLYLNAFGITDGEVIDAINNDDLGHSNKQYEPKETISEEQAVNLNNYCKEQGQDIKKVLEFFKRGGLLEMTSKQYSFAMSKIKNGDFK